MGMSRWAVPGDDVATIWSAVDARPPEARFPVANDARNEATFECSRPARYSRRSLDEPTARYRHINRSVLVDEARRSVQRRTEVITISLVRLTDVQTNPNLDARSIRPLM